MGPIEGIAAIGLGPTLLGLGAVALLGSVPWIVKLVLRSNTPSASGVVAEEEAFDADAALARYMARKAAAGDEPVVALDEDDEAPAARPSFGRKVA